MRWNQNARSRSEIWKNLYQRQEGEEDTRPPNLVGSRDRAVIAVMVFSFARVTAALGMKVEDYYGRRAWFRLHEKGGKRHEVPAHHNVEDYLDTYIAAAGIAAEKKNPFFRSIDRHRSLTDRPMHRIDAWRMIKRRAKAIGLPEEFCNHTFRTTGITAYLKDGGTIGHAQQIAAHEGRPRPKDRRCSATSALNKSRTRSVDCPLDTRCDSPDAETARRSEPTGRKRVMAVSRARIAPRTACPFRLATYRADRDLWEASATRHIFLSRSRLNL